MTVSTVSTSGAFIVSVTGCFMGYCVTFVTGKRQGLHKGQMSWIYFVIHADFCPSFVCFEATGLSRPCFTLLFNVKNMNTVVDCSVVYNPRYSGA